MNRLLRSLCLPLALAGVVLLIAVGCGDRGSDPEEPPIDVPEADLKALAEGNNEFAIELYKKLAAEHDGNLVVSPYSISSALAMTYAGARGETAEEMRETLHFTLPPDRLHPAFGGMTQWLQQDKDGLSRLHIANALWGQRGYSFRSDFLNLTRRSYGGGFRELDFVSDPGGSRQEINGWVKDRTEGRIEELLKPEDIESNTVLVLTNAICFKGVWSRPFDKGQTKDGDFETLSGNRARVPMMHAKGQFRYHAGPTFQLLELPYAGDRWSMVVILPVERRGLPKVEASLSADDLRDGLSKLAEGRASVALPRFKVASRFKLKDPLIDMGMPLAFSAADFSGMTGSRDLRIKDVIHGGEVVVDEQGTEATAATAVIMIRSERPLFTFVADHPFLFAVVDRPTGAILFIGRQASA